MTLMLSLIKTNNLTLIVLQSRCISVQRDAEFDDVTHHVVGRFSFSLETCKSNELSNSVAIFRLLHLDATVDHQISQLAFCDRVLCS